MNIEYTAERNENNSLVLENATFLTSKRYDFFLGLIISDPLLENIF